MHAPGSQFAQGQVSASTCSTSPRRQTTRKLSKGLPKPAPTSNLPLRPSSNEGNMISDPVDIDTTDNADEAQNDDDSIDDDDSSSDDDDSDDDGSDDDDDNDSINEEGEEAAMGKEEGDSSDEDSDEDAP